VDGVDRKYAELASLGVNCVGPPKLQFWGYGAEVLDPDGYMNHLGGLEADHGKNMGRNFCGPKMGRSTCAKPIIIPSSEQYIQYRVHLM
jgi:hypothetical protein